MKNLKILSLQIYKHKYLLILLTVFLFELFLRFYQIDSRDPFGYDQVDNAWAAKTIVVDHIFPTIGMPAKANSGIYIGPVYYYLLSLVYAFTNMHPIASGIAAGLTSIFNFWVIYFICKKLFSKEVAFFAVFLHTFIMHEILFERVQVPINFIPSISLLIFYVLFRITQGDYKKIPLLAILIGFDFNIHFTAIFFPIIVLFVLPLFPRNKETYKYILFSIPLFLVWILPSTITEYLRKTDYGSFSKYLGDNFHGFHLKRVLQLTGDGLIQLDPFIPNTLLKYVAIPLFFIIYLFKSISKSKLIFCYLVFLFFVVPWFGFATYKGEISDYYFSISRYIALFIVSYFLYRIWVVKNFLSKVMVLIALSYVSIINIINFLPNIDGGVAKAIKEVNIKIKNGEEVGFKSGVPESYIYYYLKTKN